MNHSPLVTKEATKINRFGLQSDVIGLLTQLNDDATAQQLLQEVLSESDNHDDPEDKQSIFQLACHIRDYPTAWKLLRDPGLASSHAKNLAILGLQLHSDEIAAFVENPMP